MAKEASKDQIANIVFECRNHDRKSQELSEMLDRRRIDIACVLETKWKGSNSTMEKTEVEG